MFAQFVNNLQLHPFISALSLLISPSGMLLLYCLSRYAWRIGSNKQDVVVTFRAVKLQYDTYGRSIPNRPKMMYHIDYNLDRDFAGVELTDESIHDKLVSDTNEFGKPCHKYVDVMEYRVRDRFLRTVHTWNIHDIPQDVLAFA